LHSAATTDAALAATATQAQRDHANARALTKSVLDEARADTAIPNTPMAQREAMRRRVARLRAQQAHVSSARQQVRRHRTALRALRYRALPRAGYRAGLRLPPANTRAGIAVRAALSRLGRPYVWGATGPDRFDCSGLTQWSYARAGIHLDRTTYQQICDGIPVPRSQVRPGDLVFPSAGHVQMAIGNNLVVEAPHAGATVRISPLGAGVQIRRPAG
jgi:cell wall-associated NlpC family hydrolase